MSCKHSVSKTAELSQKNGGQSVDISVFHYGKHDMVVSPTLPKIEGLINENYISAIKSVYDKYPELIEFYNDILYAHIDDRKLLFDKMRNGEYGMAFTALKILPRNILVGVFSSLYPELSQEELNSNPTIENSLSYFYQKYGTPVLLFNANFDIGHEKDNDNTVETEQTVDGFVLSIDDVTFIEDLCTKQFMSKNEKDYEHLTRLNQTIDKMSKDGMFVGGLTHIRYMVGTYIEDLKRHYYGKDVELQKFIQENNYDGSLLSQAQTMNIMPLDASYANVMILHETIHLFDSCNEGHNFTIDKLGRKQFFMNTDEGLYQEKQFKSVVPLLKRLPFFRKSNEVSPSSRFIYGNKQWFIDSFQKIIQMNNDAPDFLVNQTRQLGSLPYDLTSPYEYTATHIASRLHSKYFSDDQSTPNIKYHETKNEQESIDSLELLFRTKWVPDKVKMKYVM